MKALKRMFGGSKTTGEVSPEVPVMEVEETLKTRSTGEIEPIYVKSMELRSLADVQEVADELSKKGNIVILEISALMNQDPEELRRAIDQIKGVCQAIGGDVGRLTESKVIATPKFVKMEFKKA